MNREHDTIERAPGLPGRRVFGTPAAVVESAPGGAAFRQGVTVERLQKWLKN